MIISGRLDDAGNGSGHSLSFQSGDEFSYPVRRVWKCPLGDAAILAKERDIQPAFRNIDTEPSRPSFNAGSIIVRPRSVHGFERLCWAITNTMPFRVTRHSCASFNVAFAGCGGASLSVAANARRCDGLVSPQF